MRWTPGGQSGDIEDRRDQSGGGGGGFGFGGMRMGLGGLIVLFVLSLIFKQNFFALLGGGGGAPGPAVVSQPNPARSAAEKPLVEFVSFVLDDTQKTWTEVLPQQAGTPYRHAKLVLFRDSTQSACGGADSATGPFYCPGDEKVYIDLKFYDDLKQRYHAPGDFANAYVIAHEVGHHVQSLLGISIESEHRRLPNDSQNQLSVRLELQADFFAGIESVRLSEGGETASLENWPPSE